MFVNLWKYLFVNDRSASDADRVVLGRQFVSGLTLGATKG
jgi:hypothetical protein